MISVKQLSFSYSRRPFIQNMSFEIGRGEIVGFLGPSGAGKSTLQKILTGVLTSYSGQAQVNGIEIRHHNNRFYENIGVDFEYPSLYEKFTAIENLNFFGSLYSKKLLPVSELLEMVGLEHDGQKKVSAFSKGMKSRLNFIKALIHQPELLFLDEPTSGLDPSNAHSMKEIIKDQRAKGRTVILTTHNMHDAAELCDRVAFIMNGRIMGFDTPANLTRAKNNGKIKYTYFDNNKECQGEVSCSDTQADTRLKSLLEQNKILTIHSMEPTLEDVFIDLTGHHLQ